MMNRSRPRRRTAGTGLALLLCAALPAAAPARATDTNQMTAEQTLARLTEALGGAERLRRVETVYTRGRVEIAGLSGTVEEWQSARGAHRQSLDLGAVYRSDTVFDGRQGWVRDHNGQVRDLAGPQLAEEVLAAYLGSFSHLLAGRLPGSVTAGGTDPSGRYYLLRLQPQGGRDATLYLDRTTFLPARTAGTPGRT